MKHPVGQPFTAAAAENDRQAATRHASGIVKALLGAMTLGAMESDTGGSTAMGI